MAAMMRPADAHWIEFGQAADFAHCGGKKHWIGQRPVPALLGPPAPRRHGAGMAPACAAWSAAVRARAQRRWRAARHAIVTRSLASLSPEFQSRRNTMPRRGVGAAKEP